MKTEKIFITRITSNFCVLIFTFTWVWCDYAQRVYTDSLSEGHIPYIVLLLHQMIHSTHDCSRSGDGDSNTDSDCDSDGDSSNNNSDSDMIVTVMMSHTPDNIW